MYTEYNVHAYLRADGLGGTLIADHEYPARVAFVLLTQLLDKFAADVP
jgi:synaptobrevin family protein YKT6